MHRLLLLGVLVLVLGAAAEPAAAYLTGSARTSTTAAATALPAGPTPTAQARGRTVEVRWPAAALADGAPAPGYAVVRYADTAPTVPVTAGGGCGGTLTALSCTETGVPAGTWHYAVVLRAGSAWRGPAGTAGAPITVRPATAMATPTLLGAASRSTLVAIDGFDPGEALALRLDDPVAGTLLATATAGADGTAAVTAAVPASSDGPHAIHVVGASGGAASAPIRSDVTAPVTTDSTAAAGGVWTAQPQTITLTPDDGATGSGATATHWTSDGTTPTTASAQGRSVALAADGVFTLRYFSVDAAGNREAVRTAATAIRIDRTAPSPGTLTTAGATTVGGVVAIRNGQTLTANATDPVVNGAASGVASVAYYACPDTCTPTPGAPGTLLVGTATTGASYPVAWTGQPADGRYSLLARATDQAGSGADSAVVVRVVDNAGPVVAATLADIDANQAGHITRKETFRAYANAADAGVGVDSASLVANLSQQCGGGCSSVPLSATGGPFTVLTASGPVSYTHRSAIRTASSGANGGFSVRALDLLGTAGTASGTAQIDTINNVAAPVSVTLTTGAAATGFATCPVTPNGYVNASHAASSTVQVVTASTAPANGVVILTATSGTTTLSFAQVVPQAGTRTVVFDALDLRPLGDGTVSLSAVELSAGGGATSSARTQSVAKLTAAPTVATGALLYADNASPAPDRVSSTGPVGPARGYLAFTQTAGSHVGTVFSSGALSATGVLSPLDLADERTSPTYAVAAVDAACNAGAAVTWTPTATR